MNITLAIKKQILRLIPLIAVIVSTVSFVGIRAYTQNRVEVVTLDEVVNVLSLNSSAAQIEKLNFRTELLKFENFKKSYMPALSFNFNPLNFN